MQYFELKCTAYIKNNIRFENSFEIISKYINYTMFHDGLEDIHQKDGFKHYSFGGFMPFEKEKVYKQGSTYNFIIRSLDKNFIDTLSTTLRENINNINFLVVQTELKIVKQFFITELYTATPTIVSVNGKFWTLKHNGDILQLQKQLHNNLEKKYQSFFKEDLKSPHSFIQLLELKTRFVQKIEVTKQDKEITFLGNKFKIVPNEDELSQKLAFTALACGLGEKNSYGGGFCLGKGIRL